MAVDPGSILPGYAVYAHHVDASNHLDLGEFVGTVQDVLHVNHVHYLHVRGGLEKANELFVPLGAVRQLVGKQVHLGLSLEALAAEPWHVDPRTGHV